VKLVQIADEAMEERASWIQLDGPHHPLREAPEVTPEVREEINAGANEEGATQRPLRRDQPEDGTTARSVAGAHPRTVERNTVRAQATAAVYAPVREQALRDWGVGD